MYFILILAIAVMIMLGLSHPLELRPGRGLKTALSLPFVSVAALVASLSASSPVGGLGQVMVYAFCTIIVAVVWASNLAWFGARFFNHLLHGSERAGGGFRPDFTLVRHHVKEDDLDEAYRHLKEELDKDPKNYEGLLLLAQIRLNQKRVKDAVAALEIIINNSEATDVQRETARSEKQRIHYEFKPEAPAGAAPPPMKKT